MSRDRFRIYRLNDVFEVVSVFISHDHVVASPIGLFFAHVRGFDICVCVAVQCGARVVFGNMWCTCDDVIVHPEVFLSLSPPLSIV